MTRYPNFVPTINGNPMWHLGTFRHPESATSIAYDETQRHPEKYPEPRAVSAESFQWEGAMSHPREKSNGAKTTE